MGQLDPEMLMKLLVVEELRKRDEEIRKCLPVQY